MAEFILDTDHLSFVQEGHPRVVEKLSALPPGDMVFTSVVGVAELLRGVYLLPGGKRKSKLLRLYQQVIGEMEEVLGITVAVSRQFARIDVSLRRKGKPIPINDVWVAAVAKVKGAVLVTADKHFDAVDGLIVEDWTR